MLTSVARINTCAAGDKEKATQYETQSSVILLTSLILYVIIKPQKKKEVTKMTEKLTFTVYDNRTNEIIISDAEWHEVEDYAECEGRYTVVCLQNGMFM